MVNETINETINATANLAPVQVNGGNLWSQVWNGIKAFMVWLRTVSAQIGGSAGIPPYQITIPLFNKTLSIDLVLLLLATGISYLWMRRQYQAFKLGFLIKWTIIIFLIFTFL